MHSLLTSLLLACAPAPVTEVPKPPRADTLEGINAAPIWEHRDRNGAPVYRRGLGPIYEDVRLPDGRRRVALRPLWSYEDMGRGREAQDYLWPLGMWRRNLENEWRWYGLLWFTSDPVPGAGRSGTARWLMPIWFQGQYHSGGNYYGLFPVWGHIGDILGYDDIDFKLFPLRMTSRRAGAVTSSWLWPIFSSTESPKEQARRVFPFWLHSVRPGEREQTSILWPFWHSGHSLDPKKPGEWYFFFPFYGRSSLPEQDSETWLWPFFADTEGEKHDRSAMPWPFNVTEESRGKNETVNTQWYWPFWMKTDSPSYHRRALLWPICQWEDAQRKGGIQDSRFWLMPFWWSFDTKDKNGANIASYWQFWPLASQDSRGPASETKILTLWPFRGDTAVQRNWAPLWTLWYSYQSPEKKRSDFLWGIYQHEEEVKSGRHATRIFPLISWGGETAEGGDHSILLGLWAKEGRTRRLFWGITWEAGK